MKSSQLKIGVMLSYILIIINSSVNILLAPFLIGKIGQSQYGLYQLIGAFVGYLTILDFGLGNTITRYIAEYRHTKDKKKEENFLSSILILYAIIIVLVVVISIILYCTLGRIFPNLTIQELADSKIMFLILILNIIITVPGGMFAAIINGYEIYIFPRLVAILKTIGKVVVIYFVVTLGAQAIGIVIVDTVFNIIVILANYLMCKKKIKIKVKFYEFDKNMMKEIFNYSFFIFLNIVFSQVNWKVDQTIIGMKMSTIAVTIYVVGNNFSSVFQQFSTAISGVFLPKVTKMVVSGATNKELTDFMIKTGRIQGIVIVYVFLAFVFLGNQFITLIFGPNYYESWTSALILMVGLIMPLIENSGLAILQAKKKHKFYVLLDFFISFFNIIGTYYIIDYLGINGASVMTMITLFIAHIIVINIYYKFVIGLEVGRFFKELLNKLLISWVIVFVTMIIIIKYCNVNSWSEFLIFSIIYTIIYGFVILIFGLKKKEKSIVTNYINKYIKKGV